MGCHHAKSVSTHCTRLNAVYQRRANGVSRFTVNTIDLHASCVMVCQIEIVVRRQTMV